MKNPSFRAACSKGLLNPTCCNETLHRMTRLGFWEKQVWCRLGFYPWECSHCGHRMLRMDRGVEAGRSHWPVRSMAQAPFGETFR